MEFRKVAKCKHCGDPIYDHQEMLVVKGEKYHIGCYTRFVLTDGHIVLKS